MLTIRSLSSTFKTCFNYSSSVLLTNNNRYLSTSTSSSSSEGRTSRVQFKKNLDKKVYGNEKNSDRSSSSSSSKKTSIKFERNQSLDDDFNGFEDGKQSSSRRLDKDYKSNSSNNNKNKPRDNYNRDRNRDSYRDRDNGDSRSRDTRKYRGDRDDRKYNKWNNNNYNNNNNDVYKYSLTGEGLFGVNPIWVALYADNRSFNRLYILESLYHKLQDYIKDQENDLNNNNNNNNNNNDNNNSNTYQPTDLNRLNDIIDDLDESDKTNNDNDDDEMKRVITMSKTTKKNKFNINRDKKNIGALVDILKKCEQLEVEIVPVDKQRLDVFSKFRVHQGLVLDCSPLTITTLTGLSVPDMTEFEADNRYPLIIALDELWDPQNTGAIVRTCHYFGLDGVIVTDKGSIPVSPFASKSSSGAIEEFPIFKCLSLASFLQASKARGWHIIGTSVSDPESKDITNVKIDKPTVLVIGNEGYGLKDKVVSHCNEMIMIKGLQRSSNEKIDSLNASVTTGILIHHLQSTNKIK
ncbi:hypothetical protein PPL_06143 [Heterostelium album PN500]|uniref:tRNA/rRNA methyltransferase SpoU type domain-containing protein n=1 Tax=Heterostelium pallidum (strain ATCC 26659 / Pp 5 / PN500) TaxID=670386 RepID=D3BCB8_HETP5|nr:hypothetical protein PPL_06143 [Heterostelium album PN500]EFA80908.1 hypothetical protein PPL_06143 [Heterostelium album PN500]|eukprot:XP_020433026.1 hypothetical protein PPL_06143 [Heterostelium album PN500]